MSLTSDIATLVARYEALAAVFDTKKASIDAAVAAAIAAVPLLSVRYFVDAVNGSDTRDGKNAANALQTVEKALALAGPGKSIQIVLVSDYVMTTTVGVPQNSSVHIISDGFNVDTNPNVRRKFTLTVVPNTNAADGSGDWQLSGFRCGSVGYASFDFTAIEIVMPQKPATGTMIADHYNGVVGMNSVQGPTLLSVQLKNSTITMPADNAAGWIVGLHPSRALVLTVGTVVFDSARIAGRWISGFAAGTQVSASTRIMSNLATL